MGKVGACGLPCIAGLLAFFKMVPGFIRRICYSGTACQVCHASRDIVILLLCGYRKDISS